MFDRQQRRVCMMFILLSSCGVIVPRLGLADTVHKNTTLVATLSAGPAWYAAGETQTFALQPEVTNTYDAKMPVHALASGEFFLGLQRFVRPTMLGQIGVTVAKSSNASLQGDIWQTADPNFNNFTYQYQVSHAHVAVTGKLLSMAFSQTWLPYLSASLGAGFNRAYHYSAKPTIFEALPMPNFTSNTQTAFTYTAGLGVQAMLNEHWAFGVGYEFADWGQSALAPSPGQTLNTGIALAHLYTNELQFNVSYLFV